MIKVEQLQALGKAKDEACNAALVKCEYITTELQKFCKEDLAPTSTSCAQQVSSRFLENTLLCLLRWIWVVMQ